MTTPAVSISVTKALDLRGTTCPLNFVKTKLALEELGDGELLEIIIDDGEPVKNVPRSVKDEGHKILKVDNLGGAFKLLIQKVGED
ncbi:MAG: sulfurtransferase TusA family protein [Actinobacteria bacterium]|nr:sulfurtransferase TusA family protein [Actinomycetota bacterium]